MTYCPCGAQEEYLECCGRYIERHEIPSTPEALMRSRYTAYAANNLDYIQATMKSPAADNFDKSEYTPVNWIKLKVLRASMQGIHGKVEYVAYYEKEGRVGSFQEKSEFRQDNGRWYYIDGTLVTNPSTEKTGRNALCPCGSGKKFKKCCYDKQHTCNDAHCTEHHH